jgi:hypothetical protein
MEPRKFPEMSKVRIRSSLELSGMEGFVIGWMEKDGRWLYKVSTIDGDETFDNWIPEWWLETAK